MLLKYCRFAPQIKMRTLWRLIQSHINIELMSGCNNICLTSNYNIFKNVIAESKCVIFKESDKELFSHIFKQDKWTNLSSPWAGGTSSRHFTFIKLQTLHSCSLHFYHVVGHSRNAQTKNYRLTFFIQLDILVQRCKWREMVRWRE